MPKWHVSRAVRGQQAIRRGRARGARADSVKGSKSKWTQPRAQTQRGKAGAGKGHNEAPGNGSVVRDVGKVDREWFGQENGKTDLTRLHTRAKRGSLL